MKVFVTKQFGIVIAIVSLATVWNLGIATAQTAEEGIANFYSESFKEEDGQRRSLRQEQTHCIAQNTTLRNEGAGDQS